MSITDELRDWAEDNTLRDRELTTYPPQHVVQGVLEELLAIANRIDEEYKKAIRELNNLAEHSVLLPVDVDGEIIHVGDMMEYGKSRGHVIALMLSNYPKKWGGGLHWGVQLEGEQAPTALDRMFHHYREPTIKDVLREMAVEYEYAEDGEDKEAVLEEYATKLHLAKEDE